MTIHNLGYERWSGELRQRRLRWLPMVRYHVNLALKRKVIWLILLLSIVPALGFAGMIYMSSDSAREGSPLETAMVSGAQIEEFASLSSATPTKNSPVDFVIGRMFRNRQESVNRPKTMEEKYWFITTHGLFLFLLWPQSFIVMLVASAVGAGLIAQDIRSNALEIYLTKPITPLDYVTGKLCVVTIFILLTTFLPAMIVFGVAAASWQGYLSVAWPVIPLLFGACLIASLVNGVVILGLSSMAKSARYAAVIWFSLGFVSSATAKVLQEVGNDKIWSFLSYRNNFLYLFVRIFEIDLSFIPGEDPMEFSIAIPISILGGFLLISALIMRRTIRAVEAG